MAQPSSVLFLLRSLRKETERERERYAPGKQSKVQT